MPSSIAMAMAMADGVSAPPAVAKIENGGKKEARHIFRIFCQARARQNDVSESAPYFFL
jgi:hypothetical protein